MIHIVLFEPEIPQNTGNIGRTCVLTGSKLHLIKPLGFEISDKQVKRTGLDYWKDVDLEVHESYEEFREKYKDKVLYAISTKGKKYYHEIKYEDDVFLMFGRESSGLPKHIMDELSENLVRVPMINTTTRSLNLSNTVAIVAYRVLEDLDFPNMK